MKGGSIQVTSGVSLKRGSGFVQLHWNGEHGQLTPLEGRTFALSIMAACDAAESDAALLKALDMTAETQEAAMLLSLVRQARGGAESWSLRAEAFTTDENAEPTL